MVIFCDLDGVLVDLQKHMNDLYGYDILPIFSIKFYEHMESLSEKENCDFWANLPRTEDCMTLWDHIKKYNPFILTSCSGYRAAARGKKIWCKNNLGIPSSRVLCVSHSDKKKKYSCENNILIDDLDINIKEWKEMGGKAIRHKNADETIVELSKIFQQ